MIALISDIHANLEALRAVLADIDRLRVREVFCLGDTLGYGPDPRECLELVRERCRVTLLGNHDAAVLVEPDGFAESAEQAVLWHRELLTGGDEPRRWEFLAGLSDTHTEGGTLLVHGSPRNPRHEYVFPEDIDNARKMTRILALIDGECFCGHTHIPGILFAEGPEGPFSWEMDGDSKKAAYRLRPRGPKALVNVGSVGQPRDGDWRACYALWDGEVVVFRRIPYDVRTTVRKIHEQPRLMNFLGDRLLEGR
jgi:diadenosine tetraphosphatase ApaH/serine/threonine PP2A family protein phosphatase